MQKEIEVKLNDLNLIMLSGQISSIERLEDDGHKYIRFFLRHNMGNITVSISTYLFDNGNYDFINGDYVTVKGKLRYNEKKENYKFMGVQAHKTETDRQINFALIEALCVGKELMENSLIADFRHYTLKKSEVIDQYFLPFQVFFNFNRADKVNRLLDLYETYIVEGKLKYDAPSKAFMLTGEHVRSSVPVKRTITIEV